MYLSKEELRYLRHVIFPRTENSFEYFLCCQIIDVCLDLYEVKLEFMQKYFPHIDLAHIDLEFAIERIMLHYNIVLKDLN